jgi:type VI secretion system secreted protein Hcp
MAQQLVHVKVDKCPGESKAVGHEGEIQAQAWGWDISNKGRAGSSTGVADIKELWFKHRIDKASPELMLLAMSGGDIPKAVLTVRKSEGDKKLDYLKLSMEKVYITGVEAEQDAVEPSEKVSLSFNKIDIEYIPQKDDFTGDAPVKTTWKIAEGSK